MAARLQALLAQYRALRVHDGTPAVDEEGRARLENLGYSQGAPGQPGP
jgi:hypothetical protein